MKQKHFLLTAIMPLAMALIFSCSSNNENEDNYPSSSSVGNENPSSSSGSQNGGNGNSSGSNIIIETYILNDITETYFKYTENYEWYNCKEGGNLEKQINYPIKINYSIENNVLEWDTYWEERGQDTLNFSGTSSNLIGTWTRTKNKSTSCYLDYDYDSYECKDYWDVIKVEFTDDSVTITRDYCATDRDVEESEWRNDWIIKITGCDSYEVYKGSEVIKIQGMYSGIKVTYNGKTCTGSYYHYYSYSEHQSACKKAWDLHGAEGENYWYEYYYDYLYEEADKCFDETLPADFWVYKSLAAKPLKKKAKQSLRAAALGFKFSKF